LAHQLQYQWGIPPVECRLNAAAEFRDKQEHLSVARTAVSYMPTFAVSPQTISGWLPFGGGLNRTVRMAQVSWMNMSCGVEFCHARAGLTQGVKWP
jgi:hypothetical protein